MADPESNSVSSPSPHAEIEAMGAVARALEALDQASRDRVLDWASKFYRRSAASQRSTSSSPIVDGGGTTTTAAAAVPGDLATLFAEARPGTDAEKSLVAAYFVTLESGLDEFEAFSLNSSLAHLGHRVGNITRALTALCDARPALVVQTRKEGKSKQARKKFKITVEGRRRVEQMRANSGRDET
jgi:hypothetical protein